MVIAGRLALAFRTIPSRVGAPAADTGGMVSTRSAIIRRLGPTLALGLGLAIGVGPGLSLAATPSQTRKARKLSRKGAKAYKAKKYEAALKHFKAANRIVPHPNLDVNIGRTYEAMGQPDQAMVHCKIALNAAGVPARTQAAAQTCVDRVTAQLARPTLEIKTEPPGATVHIDGRPVGKTPWRGSTEPGRRQIDLERQGHKTVSHTVNAARGQHYPLAFTLEREAVGGLLTVRSLPTLADVTLNGEPIGQTPIEQRQLVARRYVLQIRKPGYQTRTLPIAVQDGRELSHMVTLVANAPIDNGRPSWPAWTLLGTGVAVVGAGAFFGVQALGDREDADALARTSSDPNDADRYNGLLSSMKDNRSASDALMVTGSAALVGALVYWLWPDD